MLMKVFVWNDPYHIKYGGSFLFAVAENVEAAKAEAMKRIGESGSLSYMPKGFSLGEPFAVHELPYAEWYEWSE